MISMVRFRLHHPHSASALQLVRAVMRDSLPRLATPRAMPWSVGDAAGDFHRFEATGQLGDLEKHAVDDTVQLSTEEDQLGRGPLDFALRPLGAAGDLVAGHLARNWATCILSALFRRALHNPYAH